MTQLAILLLLKVILLLNLLPTLSTNALSCTNSKQEWMNLRYTTLIGPPTGLTNFAPNSNICSVLDGSPSCCDSTMEQEMYTLGQRQLIELCNSWLQVARQMKNDSTSLEYLFRTDLEQAKSRLHQFFSRIYGYNYKLHRSFFFGFFIDLEQYMAGQRGQLSQLIDNFFSQLRDSIVSLIERSGQVSANAIFGNSNNNNGVGYNPNPSTGFGTNPSGANSRPGGALNEAAESRRIRCLSDRVAQLKPFDEVDVRLKARILEAYPPARMLVNILSVSSQLIFYLVEHVVAQTHCVVGITRYRFCAICAGHSMSDVCPESCSRLLANCLQTTGPNEAQLTYIWPQLIDSIVLATNRLERSFNFPAVNRNLQMEISEAITNLQTRYTETKSKFESECHPTGRRPPPTLFNPINSGSQLSPTSHRNPSFGNWPINKGINRNRYARAVNNYQSPTSVSQELLAWQTRPHQPGIIYQPSAGNPYQSSTGYNQPLGSTNTRLDGTSNLDNSISNLPETLLQHVNQIKRTYTNLRNLFSDPTGGMCTKTMNNMNKTEQKQSSQCWTPPDLQRVTPDVGITKILSQLDEASKRLHVTSANIKDTDVLVIEPPIPRSSFPSAAYQDHNTGSNLFQPQNTINQILAQDQWQNPQQPGFQNSFNARNVLDGNRMQGGVNTLPSLPNKPDQHYFEKPDAFDIHPPNVPLNPNTAFYGSNVEGSSLNRVPGPSPHLSNKYEPQQWSTPGTDTYNTNKKWQTIKETVPTSDPPNSWESSGTSMLGGTLLQELEPKVTPPPTPMVHPTPDIHTTKQAQPTDVITPPKIEITTAPPKINLTESEGTQLVKDLKDNVLVVPSISETINHTANDTSSVHEITTPTIPVTTTIQNIHRPELPPNLGSIIDDEDRSPETLRGQNQITSNPSPQEMSPWSKNPVFGQQPTWQDPTLQGSGMAPDCRNFPNSPNCLQQPYNEGSGMPNPVKQNNVPPTFYPPFNKPVETPVDPGSNKQTDWSGISHQPPITQPGIPVPPHEYNQENKQDLGAPSQWQEMSGLAYPEMSQPPLQERTQKQHFPPEVTRAPTPPRIPPILPHPPLPPPEVWIPAKLGYSQAVPPIFLIRKYDIESSVYGQEKPTLRSSVSISSPNLFIILCLIGTHQFMFYLHSK